MPKKTLGRPDATLTSTVKRDEYSWHQVPAHVDISRVERADLIQQNRYCVRLLTTIKAYDKHEREDCKI